MRTPPRHTTRAARRGSSGEHVLAAVGTGTARGYGRAAPAAQARIDAMSARAHLRAEQHAYRRSA